MMKKRKKGEWIEKVTEDMNTLEIKMSFEEMKDCPKNEFKKLVKTKCKAAYFKNITKEKGLLSKGKEIIYESLNLQDYMNGLSSLTSEDMQNI